MRSSLEIMDQGRRLKAITDTLSMKAIEFKSRHEVLSVTGIHLSTWAFGAGSGDWAEVSLVLR